MSTNMHLRCVAHDPYISSDDVGHNTSYLPQIRSAIRNRDVIVENMRVLEDAVYDLHSDDQPKRTLWWFLFNHPTCDLEIWDEYGHQYSMEDTVPEAIIASDTVLGRVVSVNEIAPYELVVKIVDLTPAGKRLLTLMDPIGKKT